MATPLFKPENIVQGVRGAGVQAGLSDEDSGLILEQSISFPWPDDAATSWLDYQCWIECYLDAGMALHKPLPQSPSNYVDTLASGFVDDPDFIKNVNGVNLISKTTFADFTQRMATSTYRFVLRGWGIRAGFQVPVPGLRSVAGLTPTPDARQWSRGNVLVGNYSGVPVWFNEWELWYLVTAPPKQAQTPPDNLAAHIRGDTEVPDKIQVPYSQPDQNSVKALPKQQNPGPFVVPKL